MYNEDKGLTHLCSFKVGVMGHVCAEGIYY